MKRGQAALEYLTTYGWAFMIILVMIGGLTYLGVTRTDELIPDGCQTSSGFTCTDFYVAEDGISVVLKNNQKTTVYLSKLNFTMDGVAADPNCGLLQPVGGSSPQPTYQLNPGMSVEAVCDGVPPGFAEIVTGEKSKLKFEFQYKLTADGFPHEVEGEVIGTAQKPGYTPPSCTPSCPAASSVACGQSLGSDGCSGTCPGTGTYCASGSCSGGTCVPSGPSCPGDADCSGLSCGPDPVCGVECGPCTGSDVCSGGVCVPSGPSCPGDADCSGLSCGPDPVCGVECGPCTGTDVCNAGVCVPPASPTGSITATPTSCQLPDTDATPDTCGLTLDWTSTNAVDVRVYYRNVGGGTFWHNDGVSGNVPKSASACTDGWELWSGCETTDYATCDQKLAEVLGVQSCLPGYSKDPLGCYCIPDAPSQVTTLYFDDFEDGADWTGTGACAADWRYGATTPSQDTGPITGDSPNDANSKFVHMETSSAQCYGPGDSGELQFNQLIDWDAQDGEYISFETNRYGNAGLGDLIVETDETGSWVQLGSYSQSGDDGNSGNFWTPFAIDASALTGSGHVRFRATNIQGYYADFAIDNFNISYGGVPDCEDGRTDAQVCASTCAAQFDDLCGNARNCPSCPPSGGFTPQPSCLLPDSTDTTPDTCRINTPYSYVSSQLGYARIFYSTGSHYVSPTSTSGSLSWSNTNLAPRGFQLNYGCDTKVNSSCAGTLDTISLVATCKPGASPVGNTCKFPAATLYADDFEDGADWIGTGGCGLYWQYNTATSSGGTGPQSGDSPNDANTKFVFMETSVNSCDGNPNGGELVFKQLIDWDAQGGEQITFETNRHGDADLGDLIVETNETGSWVQLGTYSQSGADGNSGTVWTPFSLDASSLTGLGYVRFKATNFLNFTGDAAIDNFKITYLPLD